MLMEEVGRSRGVMTLVNGKSELAGGYLDVRCDASADPDRRNGLLYNDFWSVMLRDRKCHV
jgi:hypothetical protein